MNAPVFTKVESTIHRVNHYPSRPSELFEGPITLSGDPVDKSLHYIGKLVRDEKENSDWFSERSVYRLSNCSHSLFPSSRT